MAGEVASIKEVDESLVTRAILKHGVERLLESTRVDAIVIGAGPSGLTAAYYLAKGGASVLVLEKELHFGGGTGGGGMLFPKIVVQEPADDILREFGVRLFEVEEGVYVADPAETMAKTAVAAVDAGARIVLGITVNDLVYREDRVVGAVCQWTAVEEAGVHADPLAFRAKAVIDCTGHGADVISIAVEKIPELKLEVPGEKSMWASLAERLIVERTGEVRPGLFVAGMAVAAVYRLPRMGAIFGGMFLSGKKVAELVLAKIRGG